jgi:LytR cell envelope-related transcriptional attenuator
VHNLFTNGAPPDTPIPSQSRSAPTTLDVINATSHSRLGTAVEQAFGADGLTAGTVSTAESLAETSTISYGPGAGDAAHMLADRLQLAATASDAVAADTVRLTIGADFPAAEYLRGSTSSTAATAAPVTTVDATASGTQAPAPTDLTEMAGTNTPCVK